MSSQYVPPQVDIKPLLPYGTTLRKFRTGLADRDTNPVDVVMIGDSLTELGATGVGTTDINSRWMERWVRSTASDLGMGYGIYYPAVPGAVITRQTNDPWTQVGGAGFYSLGLGLRSWIASANNTSTTATFTGNRIVVLYTQTTTASQGVEMVIDGVVATTLNMRGTLTYGKQWDSGELTSGPHTFTARFPGGVRDANFIIEGAMIETGLRPNILRVWDCSQSGLGAQNFANVSNVWDLPLALIDVDLAIIGLGANDKTLGRTVSEVNADIVTVANRVQAQVSPDASIGLLIEWGKGTESAGTWEPYANAQKSLAKANDWQPIDLHSTIGPLQTDTYGVTVDQVHPNQKGNRVISQLVSQTIFGAIKSGAKWKEAGANTAITEGNVGIGTNNPLYKLDVRTRNSLASQLHFASADVDSGGYLTTAGAGNFYMAAGAAFNGSAWVAKAANAVLLGADSGTFNFFADLGKTIGATYTPTEIFRTSTASGFAPASGSTVAVMYKDATHNYLMFPQTGIAAPSFTTRSAGNRVIIFPQTSASTVDWGFGIESGYMWSTVGAINAAIGWKWYAGTTEVMRLQSDGHMSLRAGGSTGILAKPGGTTSTNTTTVGNVGTGEDDLMTYAVPANTLSVNHDRIDFKAVVTIANNVNAKRVRVKFGATTFFDTGAAGIPISNALVLTISGSVIRTGAATQKCYAQVNTNNATLAAYSGYATAAETLSNAITLKLTGEAVSDNDVVQELMMCEWKSAA